MIVIAEVCNQRALDGALRCTIPNILQVFQETMVFFHLDFIIRGSFRERARGGEREESMSREG